MCLRDWLMRIAGSGKAAFGVQNGENRTYQQCCLQLLPIHARRCEPNQGTSKTVISMRPQWWEITNGCPDTV